MVSYLKKKAPRIARAVSVVTGEYVLLHMEQADKETIQANQSKHTHNDNEALEHN